MKMNVLISFILVLFSLQLMQSQVKTYVPDDEFEQALIDQGFDEGALDDYVFTDSIISITNLNVFNKHIKDLTGIEDFKSLETLNCSNNALTNLDLSKNLELIELDCSSNAVTGANLKVTNNPKLEKLYASENLLTNLNISENKLLRSLDLTSNQFSTINLKENDSLRKIKISNNRLIDLVINNQTKLEELQCSNNQLNSLNLVNNKTVRNLLISSNQIKTIDLKKMDSLLILDISNNQINQLELNTSTLLTNFTASDNEFSDLNLAHLDSLSLLSVSNNELKTLDISNNLKLKNLIAANNQLTNIDYSKNIHLKEINVSTNLITSVKLEENDSITSVDFSFNLLRKIDFSRNMLLKSINLSNNEISELDMSVNDSITSLVVSDNSLIKLNLKNGNNSALTTLISNGNKKLFCIQIDDITQIGDLWIIDVHTNYYDDATSSGTACIGKTYIPDMAFELALIAMGLDMDIEPDNYVLTSAISGITELDISGKGIVDLTGIEDFSSLELLNCSNNLISNLELINQTNVTDLTCKNNLINLLFLKGTKLEKLDATGNSNLSCIIVDDIDIAKANVDWKVEDTNLYKIECDGTKTYIPDDNFEQALIDLGLDMGPLNDSVYTSAIIDTEFLELKKKNISDLRGIEDFKNLKSLNCSENNLTSLDISSNNQLLIVKCFSNYLTSIDISQNQNLTILNSGNNKINELDVTQNLNLLELVMDNNNLTDLDLSNNLLLRVLNINANHISNENIIITNKLINQLLIASNEFKKIFTNANDSLRKFDCSNNKIEILNLAKNKQLRKLNTSNNLLEILDVNSNLLLEKVNTNSNFLKYLDFENHTQLDSLSCDNNQIQKSMDANVPDGLIVHSAKDLRFLSASDNQMSQIRLTNNTELISLDVGGNLLNTIDVSKNTKLIRYYCDRNDLDKLSITNNAKLELLKYSYNEIATIDLSNNTELKEVSGSDNSISELNTSNLQELITLKIDNNNLNELNLSQNELLQELSFSGNSVSIMNLSLNINLVSINAGSNSLNSFNLKNGNNNDLETFVITNNSDLTCIEVNDAAFAEANENWRKDDIASYNENCHYSDTYVPDDNFELALTIYDDVPNDNYVPTSNIDVLEELNLSNKNITDLTGIEDFINLKTIDVSNNELDSLNLTYNTALSGINCANNKLFKIELSGDTEVLEKIFSLNISSNKFNEFDWSAFSLLHILDVSSNSFTDLDLSKNESLTNLNCSSNQLLTLNLKNGFNGSLGVMDASSNQDLVCIEVDDISLAILSSWQKDDIASYNKNCHYYEVYVPDDAFEQALIDAGYDYEGTSALDNYVPDEKILTATSLDLSNKGIVDLTGLEAFSSLVFLNVDNNDISDLNISNNLKLKKLYCSDNNLSVLDLSNNNLLEEFKCVSNNLSNISLINNKSITTLKVDNNPISTLELENSTSLSVLNCSSTQITYLDLSMNIELEKLKVTNNPMLLVVDIQSGNNEALLGLNLTSNPILNCILVDNKDEAYANINWIKDDIAGYKLICDDDDNDGISNAEDQCPSTPFGDFVDLFGCSIFSLPIDNFKILVTDENCNSSDNGKIFIESKEVHNFIATISNDEYFHTANFGADVEVRNLKAGVYELCIIIAEREKYTSCYEVLIDEPENLSVFSSVNDSEETVSLKMTGAKKYVINHNGSTINTSNPDIIINLSKGVNNIKVKTEFECQGVYEKTIFSGKELTYYPNPFKDNLHIYLGRSDLNEVHVNIYSALGQLVLSKYFPIINGSIKINGTSFSSGVYTLLLPSSNEQPIIKIVKI